MSEQAANGGKINEEGYSRHLYNLLTSGVGTRTSTSWKAIQRAAGANMSVDVQQGDGFITISDAYGYPAWVASSDKNVSVDAADVSNPRIDRLVAYISLADISTSVTNNTGALKFKAVAGTPAGSPSAPSDGTVQSAVGASNPYIDIAQIAVAAGATSISTANITDKRQAMAVRAPLQRVLTTKSASFTMAATEDIDPVSCSGGAVTCTLPDATRHTGRIFGAYKSDSSSNALTFARTSSQTINGTAADLVVYQQFQGAEFMSDGSNWILHRWIGTRLLNKVESTGTTTANTTQTVNTLTLTMPPVPTFYELNGKYMFHGSTSVNDIKYTLSDGTNEVCGVYSHSAAQNQRTPVYAKSKVSTVTGSKTLTSTLTTSGNAGSIVGDTTVPMSTAVYVAV